MENLHDCDVMKRWKEQAEEARAEAVIERRRKRPRRTIENGGTPRTVNAPANEGRVEEASGFSGRRVVLITD